MTDRIQQIRDRVEMYDARLREGDNGGSLVGASFIIARTMLTDCAYLLAEVERLRVIEEAARDVVSPCDFGNPPPSVVEYRGGRRWCLAHHEYDRGDGCPMGVLAAALTGEEEG